MIKESLFLNFVDELSNVMHLEKNIKRIRKAKKLSQKEVISTIGMGPAQYSRIEGGKTDPSISTLDRIAKALGVKLSELFSEEDKLEEINSQDRTLMEKVQLIETLSEEEKKMVFSFVDALVGKKKLKDALSSALDNT